MYIIIHNNNNNNFVVDMGEPSKLGTYLPCFACFFTFVRSVGGWLRDERIHIDALNRRHTRE